MATPVNLPDLYPYQQDFLDRILLLGVPPIVPLIKIGMRNIVVKVVSPTGAVEDVDIGNANDMVVHLGYRFLNLGPNPVVGQNAKACDACLGLGSINDHEPCWHCGGDGIDPTK